VMTQEVAVAVAFSRTLAARNQLHGSINKESVDQRFQLRLAGLFSMFVVKIQMAASSQPLRRGCVVPMCQPMCYWASIFMTFHQRW